MLCSTTLCPRRFTTFDNLYVIYYFLTEYATRVKAFSHCEKIAKGLPILPSRRSLFSLSSSPSIYDFADCIVDNPPRRRERFSRLLHQRFTLEGFTRAIIQSRELEAAGTSTGCRPSWWGSKIDNGKYAFSHLTRTRFSFQERWCNLLCLLCYLIAQHRTIADDIRPYEFSFNIVDFQHRFEKKGIYQSKTR